MAKINVQGLGVIQIEGDKPSAQEIEIIQKLINTVSLKVLIRE